MKIRTQVENANDKVSRQVASNGGNHGHADQILMKHRQLRLTVPACVFDFQSWSYTIKLEAQFWYICFCLFYSTHGEATPNQFLQEKAFNWGLRTVSEAWHIITMVEGMVACRRHSAGVVVESYTLIHRHSEAGRGQRISWSWSYTWL